MTEQNLPYLISIHEYLMLRWMKTHRLTVSRMEGSWELEGWVVRAVACVTIQKLASTEGSYRLGSLFNNN